MRRRSCVSLVALLALTACGGSDGRGGPTAAEWVGTVSTEGNVTTVVNESGSVWGGDATLVEEVSIGVEAGDDVYMFGAVRAVAMRGDEIYVLDQQVPALRVYDMNGRHLRDIGAEGGGPAEFRRPDSMVIGPAGRIYVRDYGNDRITIFAPDGDEVGTLPLDGGFATSTPLTMTLDGTLYNYQRIPSDDPEERLRGLVPRSLEDDEIGEPILPPELSSQDWSLSARREGMSISMNVPFAPGTVWTVAPTGAVVAGYADEYSFEIRYPDGAVTRVVKEAGRVAVDPDEADWHRRSTTARMRRNVPDWNWNGPDIPAQKPAYRRLIPDRSGRIWVVRPGPGARVEGECDDNPAPDSARQDPCWRESVSWEVFDDEGRFLGVVGVPDEIGSPSAPYIEDDVFLAPAVDELGTGVVKLLRLHLPGQAGS